MLDQQNAKNITTDAMDALAERLLDEHRSALPDGYRPIIGIPVPVEQGEQGPILLADAIGAWSVERSRGRVFLIPLWPFSTHNLVFQSLWPLMQSMDGLLLPAGLPGTNWYAHWLERESQPGMQTWPIAWEMALAQLASYIGMPVLAIGDGAERWNIALGGSVAGQQAEASHMAHLSPDRWERQIVRVRAGSKLATWMQHALAEKEEKEGQQPWTLAFMPNTQGVEKLALGLRACAQSDRGSVAAFERRDPTFGLGILPRVDWSLDQAYGAVLFEAFMHASRSFAVARQQNSTTWESSRDEVCATVYERVSHNLPLLPHHASPTPMPVRAKQSDPLTPTGPLVDFPEKAHSKLRQQPSLEELRRAQRRRLKTTTK